MKNKLMILVLSATALVVSADCQAMMRSAPARVAPAVAKAKSAFKLPAHIRKHVAPNIDDRVMNIKQNQFPLPAIPAHRVDSKINQRYEDLSLQLAEKYADIARQKKHKRHFNYLAPLALMTGPFFFLYYAPLVSLHDAYADILLKMYKKEQVSIEAELAEILSEQKRILRIPDDIQ